MSKRVISALVLLILGFPAVVFGGIFYFLLIGFLLAVAAWEYVDMFEGTGSSPARWLVVGGTVAISAARFFIPAYADPVFTLLALALMAFHLVQYERGGEHTASDFAASLSGLAYLGWLGSYLLALRALENGGWWVMYVLPVVWCVDTGAFMLGAVYGKNRMSPRLSPKKSWEGFAAGIFTGVLGGGFFAYAYSTWGPLNLPIWLGAAFGLVIGLLTPLGDLGESMLKRQAGMKDSGKLIPGHGGAFDRIDSWLWAGVLGYYFIIWFIR